MWRIWWLSVSEPFFYCVQHLLTRFVFILRCHRNFTDQRNTCTMKDIEWHASSPYAVHSHLLRFYKPSLFALRISTTLACPPISSTAWASLFHVGSGSLWSQISMTSVLRRSGSPIYCISSCFRTAFGIFRCIPRKNQLVTSLVSFRICLREMGTAGFSPDQNKIVTCESQCWENNAHSEVFSLMLSQITIEKNQYLWLIYM